MYPKMLEKNNIYFYTNDTCFAGEPHITRGFVETNYSCGMHEQAFYEINIIVKGKGVHYIKDNKIPVKTGDVFILPPLVPHGYYGGEGFDVYHVLLSNEFCNIYFPQLQQLPCFYTLFNAEPLMRSSTETPLYLSLTNNQFKQINEILNTLLKYDDWYNPFDCLKNCSTVITLITSLCEIYSYNFDSNKVFSKDEYFMKTLSYIHEHYQEKITLDFLVQMAQMSRSSYVNKFKQICKMPPLAYLNKIRIEVAEKLLIDPNFSVAEVAYRTGFYDCSHFAKIFLSEKKISPFAYKKLKANPTL